VVSSSVGKLSVCMISISMLSKNARGCVENCEEIKTMENAGIFPILSGYQANADRDKLEPFPNGRDVET
jgi:hypothetical protein